MHDLFSMECKHTFAPLLSLSCSLHLGGNTLHCFVFGFLSTKQNKKKCMRKIHILLFNLLFELCLATQADFFIHESFIKPYKQR